MWLWAVVCQSCACFICPVIYNSLCNSLPPWLGFRWVSLLSFGYARFPPALVLYICSSVCLKDPSPRMPMLLSFLHFALFSDFLFFPFKKKIFIYLFVHWISAVALWILLHRKVSLVAAYRFRCSVARGILVPIEGIESASPELQGRLSSTGPPGSPLAIIFLDRKKCHLLQTYDS